MGAAGVGDGGTGVESGSEAGALSWVMGGADAGADGLAAA